MRIFEPTEELELHDGERLVGIYVPGLRYNCRDDGSDDALARTLDRWLADGVAKVVEEREAGAQSASAAGVGEVR